MKCPNCNVDLLMSERQGIEIDYCPTCRGIWLDRGELDKIIERSAAEYASPNETSEYIRNDYRQSDSNYRGDKDYRHDKYDDYKKHKKKKPMSFLEDILDFG